MGLWECAGCQLSFSACWGGVCYAFAEYVRECDTSLTGGHFKRSPLGLGRSLYVQL